MSRSIWSGSLSFGLVNVPVRLYSATQTHDIHFHQFEQGTGRRVRNMRVAEDTKDEVAYEDVVKGYEVGDDQWVMLTQDELDTVEPHKSRTIDIEDFVSLDEIDPIYFERTYYLGPDPDRGAERAYRLLLETLKKTRRVGIGRFVMRGKEYLAAIRPVGDVLALETLYFGDEVRDPRQEIDNLPAEAQPSRRELEVAGQLVESLTTKWKPESYRDSYRDEVRKLIDRKAAGETVEVGRHEPEPAAVVDLLAALEASVARRASRAECATTDRPKARSDGQGSRGQGSRGQGSPKRSKQGSSARGRKKPETPEHEPSRDELLEMAKRAEIKGRSKMSKEELAAALSKAS